MIRLYAMLSLVAAVAIVGAAFMRVIIHFVYKVRKTGPTPAWAHT